VKTKLHDGREHLAAYDSLGRLDSTTDAKLQVIRYTYWYETGQTLTLKDAKLQTTTWFYNQLGQLLTKLYPNGDDHAYEYDGHHRMHKHTTPKNEVCTYSYDVRDRQTLADWNTTTPDTAKTWWANGLLKSIDNGVSKSDYAYSVKNQLTSETQTLAGQTAKVVSHTYDADGLRLQMNSPSGSPVDYEWTAKAQLDVISRDGPPPLANYAYDKAGRLDTLTHENGIVQDLTYDAASQLQSRVHKQGGTTTVSGHGYTLDATGRRTAETFPGTSTPARTYGYDTADQVTSANYDGGGTQTDAYAYDPAGNRSTATVIALGGTATTYTANSVNQYTSITGISVPVHDANGNLTFQNGVTYTWDSENRLLSVSDGTTVNTFTYDALHRRVTMRTAVSGTVTNKVHYLYDGWNVIEERTNTDTTPGFALSTFALTKTLTWGTDFSGTLQGAGGVGGLLLITDHSALGTSSYHFQYDGNGNVTEITDHTGASAATYRYDAFGNTLVSTGTYAATNRYRFSTKPLDDEITNAPLYYYAYRYYDPVTGRWPSRDPIQERGGVNLYGFVGNDGVNRWDLFGLSGSATHGGRACLPGDDCATLASKAQWFANSIKIRIQEIINSQPNGQSYENYVGHQIQIAQQMISLGVCITLWEAHIPPCCDDDGGIPVPIPWSRVPAWNPPKPYYTPSTNPNGSVSCTDGGTCGSGSVPYPENFWQNTGYAAAAVTGTALILADGPLPVGDAAGVPLVIYGTRQLAY
jgi:RHS repeat-associated protein